MNYYYLLEVNKEASLDEIKKAFRKKLKTFHPDTSPHPHAEQDTPHPHKDSLIDLIDAYNVLSSSVKRKHYDAMHSGEHISNFDNIHPFDNTHRHKTFNYEVFLIERIHEWKYKVKFFLFDLVLKKGDRAANIYESLTTDEDKDKLQQTLGFYDYFDCLYLLVEYYVNLATTTAYNKALKIVTIIAKLEDEKKYFKDYMEEVAEYVFLIFDRSFKHLDKEIVKSLLLSMKNWAILPKQQNKVLRYNSKFTSKRLFSIDNKSDMLNAEDNDNEDENYKES